MPEQDVSAHAAIICERIQTHVGALLQQANSVSSLSDQEKAVLIATIGLAEIAVGALVRIADALEAK